MILRKILIKKSPEARAVPLQNMSGLKRLLLLHDCTSECSVQTTPLKNLLPVKNHCRLELVCVAVITAYASPPRLLQAMSCNTSDPYATAFFNDSLGSNS